MRIRNVHIKYIQVWCDDAMIWACANDGHAGLFRIFVFIQQHIVQGYSEDWIGSEWTSRDSWVGVKRRLHSNPGIPCLYCKKLKGRSCEFFEWEQCGHGVVTTLVMHFGVEYEFYVKTILFKRRTRVVLIGLCLKKLTVQEFVLVLSFTVIQNSLN